MKGNRKLRTDTQAINAGALTRFLVVLFVKARNQKYIRRVWKPSLGLTSAWNVCIKVKPFDDHLAEAHAMQLVGPQTSIPVPKVYCAFGYKGTSYIVMSRVQGKTAWLGWLQRTPRSKARVLEQLRRMLAELRSIPPPEGVKVGNVDGVPFYDCRLPSKLFWGPYETDLAKLIEFYRRAPNELVLTHGDLSSLNVLVRDDEVVGIVDWEIAGCFPPYWERKYFGAF
ncbi:kinase-like domain-containing protein [Achaetomium macrosporum]|uniref:non-specific serine/threonine protein kinase n=1 Tax=Achaetomium macrosporum TaxID=79813 RepID=A0AAN7C7E6_9PEZI|nr:kinase-like domain-containing protein [Achaetomium macrosporum]